MATSPPSLSQELTQLVVRERQSRLPISELPLDPRRLAAYLALVDRPVTALLARDRLRREGPGQFTYSSRPFRLLGFELLPSLQLCAAWQGGVLRLHSLNCRIKGLGAWENAVIFEAKVWLWPAPQGLEGLAQVSLALPAALPRWSTSLAGTALEQVLDRIENRFGRGLRKDLIIWLSESGVAG
jgi:hypothetical protein